MAIDEMKSESPADEIARLADEYHDNFIPENSSGLSPVLNDITDICSDLYGKLQDFVNIHNSLKDYEPNADTICDASYGFHKISYMLSECVKYVSENIDTSWYNSNT